jgi:hypothetical protein
VPASTLAFASLEGIGRLEERWSSTAIGKFLAEPEVKAFLEPIGRQVTELLQGGGPGGGGRRGRGPLGDIPPFVMEAIQQLQGLDGQVAIALVDIDEERGIPRAVASLDFGGHVKEFVEFLGKLQKQVDPEGRRVKSEFVDGRPTWSVDLDGVQIAATVVQTSAPARSTRRSAVARRATSPSRSSSRTSRRASRSSARRSPIARVRG